VERVNPDQEASRMLATVDRDDYSKPSMTLREIAMWEAVSRYRRAMLA